jgi:2-polyprenyl-3-methyl-5-hydroxy-6-metoxy-1,4-benzoquinol methylase
LSFLGKMKSAAKRVTPRPLRRLVGEYIAQRWNARHEGRPVKEIFSAIYRERRWGAGEDGFSSGDGTHAPSVVLPYVSAVRSFLESLPSPPSVVDLGCGDFNVGEQLRPFCGPYVACDIVPALIERNKQKFADAKVNFRCLDIIDDELPAGDIVFLRQVLQHLNNAQILRIVPKLHRYQFLVVTEHLPANTAFPPNLDKLTGAGTRLPQNSGVVLTAPPFLLRVNSESVLCSIPESIGRHPGIVKTTLYQAEQ